MKRNCLLRLSTLLACLLFLSSLTGCGGQAPVVNYYSLSSVDQHVVTVAPVASLDVAVGVGPLTIPDYLKRVHIVTSLGENQYQFAEYHRWAGLIERDIITVLGTNLSALLQTEAVAAFPWQSYFKPDYRVVVDVIQFDGELAGEVVLNTRWAVSDSSGKEVLYSGRSKFRRAVTEQNFDALVKAESRLLADFSREVAEKIKALAN